MRTLYLTLSGATTTPEETAPDLVRLLQDEGWRVTVLCTPTGTRFHDLDALEELTGEPVRVDFRRPGTGVSLPPPDAVLACPWTFNSTNKTALGITDTFAVALVCEMIGRGVPTFLVPKGGDALAGHPAWDRSLGFLDAVPHVTLLRGPTGGLPTWRRVADALAEAPTS
ncbi:flavoprotein [Nocardiopsis changdeensis]|uniref:Flavoprotein n=1 Tax=Nocardiopsis changdeensis TaxID=2831969 RepID=A0ABX8BSI4_9ACTN|nr:MULTISPECIES: flavoprotein [Nocardiopsis]QUX24972.1 flavoprotein [Nocardiopsis changdeensis]QYX35358.1 flavoprotein [Nocardiopsis sp. MT53]